MNEHEWQAKAKEKLQSLAVNARTLVKNAGKATPGLLYGALSTATIFPLVEAYRQAIGAQNYPLLMALGGLAAGMGGNLVAEQISIVSVSLSALCKLSHCYQRTDVFILSPSNVGDKCR